MADINFEVKKKLGTISVSKKGLTKEINYVSWNGHEAKYDIRNWDAGDPLKGITLSEEELKVLKNLLNNLDI